MVHKKDFFFLLSDKKQCEDHEGGQNNSKVFSDTHQCMWVFLFLFFRKMKNSLYQSFGEKHQKLDNSYRETRQHVTTENFKPR